MDAEWPDTSSDGNENEPQNQNQTQIAKGGNSGGSRGGGFMDDRKRVGLTAGRCWLTSCCPVWRLVSALEAIL